MLRLFLILIPFCGSLAFLQKSVESIDVEINPKYGNITKTLDNSTHTGAVDMWLNQSITNFTVALVILIVRKSSGELFANFTIKPCVNKLKQKINAEAVKSLGFAEKTSQSFEALPGRTCPIEKGRYKVAAKESRSRLPLTVSSLNGTPGSFIKNATLQNIENGEIFLNVIEHYRISIEEE